MKTGFTDAYSLFRNNNRALLFAFSVLLFTFFLCIPSFSVAGDFTTATLGDYGNVTVMEVTGSYDAKNTDGTINSIARQAIAGEFFRTHKDEYDFIVIFSNFDFQMPDAEAKAFYLHVKNDIQGIGNTLYDNSALFGSDGKLQGIIDMGNVATLPVDPIDPAFETTLSILAHEQMHRWGAYVKFKDPQETISTAFLGKDDAHWSYLLNSYGSVLYGNQWQDNGNGTFTSIVTQKYYSPLDLYLMGVYDKSQVPPMLLIENPNIDPARMPETGTTIAGTPRYITIDDIISAEGERIPGYSDAQKNFKTAFIFITAPGTFDFLSTLLKNSVHYVHKSRQADSNTSCQGIPVEINLHSPGPAFDLRITETYPLNVRIYDFSASRWITENPWAITSHLEAGELKSIQYFAVPPDMSGTYTLNTVVEYSDNGSYIPYRNLSQDLIVDEDRVTIAGDIIAALGGLHAEGRQKAKVNDAMRHVEYTRKRTVTSTHDMEQNIFDILKAIDALISFNGIDASAIRLQMDKLLRIWEGRYYLDSMQ